MDNRRDFLKKLLLYTGSTGLASTIPPSIQRALAIAPAPGTTFMDAEHVVILMQENRSFDHALGTLAGVRGFNDPRFIRQANHCPIWFQSDAKGNTYAPFHFDLRGSKATWMGAVPHSRQSQVDAYHEGRHDQWIEAKKKKPYEHIPLTMGYYNRLDLPFNYALADAFTVCDQNFCSGMTSTWPNRLFFWTGTIRESADPKSKAWIRNELQRGEAKWKTFPERLEEAGVSWRAYQNDVSFGGGFEGEERSWLSSFSCNPLEFFEQYHIHFASRYTKSLKKQVEELPKEIQALQEKLRSLKPDDKTYQKTKEALKKKEAVWQEAKQAIERWSQAHFEQLSSREKNLFKKAFTTNAADPHYHDLERLSYRDNQGVERELSVPKGDVLYQFRRDVESGQLPAVSWMIPAEKYSDHPTSPWYGSWYVSEIMDILTKNPEVWQKTILILTYDENDGYFDHIPPFVPPNPYKSNSGKCSEGIDTKIEYITLEEELADGKSTKEARGAAIGLGFRVPLIVASPWTRGGKVCSQVFDHTSTLQFLEKWVYHKFKKELHEENISSWRRTVCGDLTSVFTVAKALPANDKLPFIQRNPYVEGIHQAQYKEIPSGFEALKPDELQKGMDKPHQLVRMPRQEPGIKAACALPYELYAEGERVQDSFQLNLRVGDEIFGKKSAGAPFTVYTPHAIRSYAVKAGDQLSDRFEMEEEAFDLQVHGPNGFYRGFQNQGKMPACTIRLTNERVGEGFTGNAILLFENKGNQSLRVAIRDMAYGTTSVHLEVRANQQLSQLINLSDSHQWYDMEISIEGYPGFRWAYAGKVETGKAGYTDPQIGNPQVEKTLYSNTPSNLYTQA